MAKRHPLDELVDRVRKRVQRDIDVSRNALYSRVHVGEVRMTKREQLDQWLKMSPAARQMLAQQAGPVETFMHERAMLQQAFKQIGPAAAPLVEYIMPYITNPLGDLEGGEGHG